MRGIVRVMNVSIQIDDPFCVIVLQKIIADFLIHYYAICRKELLEIAQMYLR